MVFRHLQQGIPDPVFYCDLVYKFKIIVEKTNLSDQFKKMIKRFKKWDMTWIQCLVVNPITVFC